MKLDPGTRFLVPAPQPAAVRQLLGLAARGRVADALKLGAMLATPSAVWFTGGTPDEVRRSVARTMLAARLLRRVPVLVAYDVPFRDCAQHSAGGAADTASYLAWIDGFASGIGAGEAIVILEPDGLGLLPGGACPSVEQDRFEQLNGAVDRIARQPNARVYLDGTHSAWLDVDEAAARLVRAGVGRARGFFLNVSNFRPTPELERYGTQLAERTRTRFVIDTSRNGQGPWTGTLDWCNPPGRGAGLRPSADTGVPFLDAYLWVKVPGQSDGRCDRDGTGHDPEWGGIVDPAAGDWFPQQALQLARLASPPLPGR